MINLQEIAAKRIEELEKAGAIEKIKEILGEAGFDYEIKPPSSEEDVYTPHQFDLLHVFTFKSSRLGYIFSIIVATPTEATTVFQKAAWDTTCNETGERVYFYKSLEIEAITPTPGVLAETLNDFAEKIKKASELFC